MTKEVFLRELERGLHQLPADEINRRKAYYEELLADMMEDGISEEDAVAKLGDLSEIINEILRDTPLPTLVKTRLHPKHGWTVAAITIAILGSPIWVSLLFALIVTVGAMILAFFSVILALFLTVIALALAGVMVIIHGFGLFAANIGLAVFSIGTGLIMLGLVCLSFLAAKYASIGLYRGGRWLVRSAKGLLIKKEG